MSEGLLNMFGQEVKKELSVTLLNKLNYSVDRSNYILTLTEYKSYHFIISKDLYSQQLILDSLIFIKLSLSGMLLFDKFSHLKK